jgi:hypothetical protein
MKNINDFNDYTVTTVVYLSLRAKRTDRIGTITIYSARMRRVVDDVSLL